MFKFEKMPLSNKNKEPKEEQPKEEKMQELPAEAIRLRNRVAQLRQEIQRQEEFEKNLSKTTPENKLGAMKQQQDVSFERNKKEIEEIQKKLKNIYGAELPE